MHVHLIAVAGTGMGSFAGLLKAAGHRVTGSDTAFNPPMGDALRRWGVETVTGFDPSHLDPVPDMVVVGNVCRPDNPEARAAIDRGMNVRSFPKALAELFLHDRRSLVITGTHGKTTTTALTAYLLDAAGHDPSFLVGGIAKNFDASYRLGRGGAFVVEGDEYDSAFFEKIPKCWSYRPWSAVITSIEHDHIDIYPTPESYRDAFRGFVSRIASDGVLVANARDPEVVAIARNASCRVVWYSLTTDECPGGITPEWQIAPIAPSGGGGGMQPFELFLGGTCAGRFFSPLMGEHNLRNTLASIALLAESVSIPIATLTKALPGFEGVKRRQERIAVVDGVTLYDDFAHHPTAVSETLRAMRGHHPGQRLVVVFEPRSATACRSLHQSEYESAFDSADSVFVAPIGRSNIPESERLDVPAMVRAIRSPTRDAHTVPAGDGAIDALVRSVASAVCPGNVVAILSNGAFGGFHSKLTEALDPRSRRDP